MTLVQASAFSEITALLTIAAAAGVLGLFLKQPMIVSFIAVGLLIGPSGLGLISSSESVDILAELGISLLLFLVGLKLDVNLVKKLGVVSLATGLGQVLFTSLFGFLICLGLGFDKITSLYIAVALTFSSTIIIIKILSDKKEVDSLHGRIAVGFLIVQDLFVVFAMMVLSSLGVVSQQTTENSGTLLLVTTLGSTFLFLIGLYFFIKHLASPLMHLIARSTELLVIFAIAWAALFALTGDMLGFSKELGGLLAGVSLASTPFRETLITRLSSLRDFLLLFFFIALGSHLDLNSMGQQIFPSIILSIFVLIGNPLIVVAIMGFMGYRKRTSFLAGLTVAQISEFSLIFIAMGISLGHLTSDALGVTTLVGLITIALSVYLITYSHFLYKVFSRPLQFFERNNPFREIKEELNLLAQQEKSFDVIIFGIGRFGAALAKDAISRGLKVLAVDYNPEVIKRYRELKCSVLFGDALDIDFIQTLHLKDTKWVISAVPEHDLGVTHHDPRIVLIDTLKEIKYEGKIAVTTHFDKDKEILLKRGSDLVFIPYQEAANKVADIMFSA